MCSDCEADGLEKHGLTTYTYNFFLIFRQIAAEKNKEQPKTVILKVLNNDMDGCPMVSR